MTEDEELQAEIERIAKLRGRPAPTAQVSGDASMAYRAIGIQRVRGIFSIPETEAALDVRIFDCLPPRSREFIREAPVFISAGRWADALQLCGERALIDLVRQCIPARGRELVARRYGPHHPQAGAEDFTIRAERSARSIRQSKREEICRKIQARK